MKRFTNGKNVQFASKYVGMSLVLQVFTQKVLNKAKD